MSMFFCFGYGEPSPVLERVSSSTGAGLAGVATGLSETLLLFWQGAFDGS